MRMLSRLAVVLMAFSVILFSSGCGTDTPGGGGGGVVLNPIVTLNSGAGLVSFNEDRDLATPSFIVNVTGQDGDALLRDLAIRQDGTNLPLSALNFRTGQTANNPIALTGDDANGFTYEIEITPPNPMAGATTFTFVLTDVDGEVGTTSVTVNYVVFGPDVQLIAGDDRVTGDVTVTGRNPSFDLRVQSTSVGTDLFSIAVLEDGELLDAGQLTYNGGAFDAENPLVFAIGEETGATYDITVRPNVSESGTRNYIVRVTDVAGQTTDVPFAVTFDVPPGTPLTFNMEGVFFNASGSQGGGLDLDNGTAVGFNNGAAEIEDEGVNLNAPVGQENWRAQVSATNDAILRIADLSTLGDGVTFDDIDATEDIAALYDQGSQPDGDDNFPDTDGDNSTSEIVTRTLIEGDVLAVRRDTRFYLVRIDAVNYVAGSNNDSYTVSIKY